MIPPTRPLFGSRTLRSALAALLFAAACSAEPAAAPPQAEAPAPPPCDIPECFRPVECVAKCGGPVLSSSCCECPEGQLDRLVQCPESNAPAPETGADSPSSATPPSL